MGPSTCSTYRKPLPDVSRVQPPVLVDGLCSSLGIFQVSQENIWSFDTYLEGEMTKLMKFTFYRYLEASTRADYIKCISTLGSNNGYSVNGTILVQMAISQQI